MPERLNTLAAEIRHEVAQVGLAFRTGLQHAAAAGRLLHQAKAHVKAAKLSWLKWIEEECQFGRATANNYMRIADAWSDIEAELAADPSLTIKKALSLLAEKKPVTPATPARKSKSKKAKAKRFWLKLDGTSFLVVPRAGITLDVILETLRTLAEVSPEAAQAVAA
jgi:hypothetical protein